MALSPITFSTELSGCTPQPLNLNGFGQGTWPSFEETNYFVADQFDGDTWQVWEWTSSLSGGVPSIIATFNVQTVSGLTSCLPFSAPQSGGFIIEGNDWRFRGFEYRNGFGWTADSISWNPGAGTVDCVRWTELDPLSSPPVVVQSGVLSSKNRYRIFPGLPANHCDYIAVGYTRTNGSSFPRIWVTCRESGDALGTLQAEILVKTGESTYFTLERAPLRWGDYTDITSDPDDLTFWYLSEYSKSVTPGPAAN